MGNFIDLTGARFGRLLVISREANHIKGGQSKWLCLCDCKNKTIVISGNLRFKRTHSCGCLANEVRGKGKDGKGAATHGCTRAGKMTKEYSAWRRMKSQCLNPNFKRYNSCGGRGIRVCEKWVESFEAFLADMGLAPSKQHIMQRINRNGNFEPLNCRWTITKTRVNDGE